VGTFDHRDTVAVPTLEDPQPPSDQPDPFDGLVLDEDFVRGAKEKESSARARMLAAKWKHEPPTDTSFRPAPAPRRRWYGRRQKLYAVSAPAKRRSRLAGRLQAPLFILIAVVLVLVAMNPGATRTWLSKHFGGSAAPDLNAGGTFGPASPAATPSLQAPETARPTAPPSSAPGVATLADPFAGSPALTWPQGAGSIVVPAAHPVGVYSGSTVASYLQKAKDFLVDSNLDPSVLAGGYPSAAIALIDPKEASLVSQLQTDLSRPSEKDDPTDLISRFDPQQALLDGSVVKVQGELTYKGDGNGGLAIHADYTFVYALRPGPDPDAGAPASAAPAAWLAEPADSGDQTDGTDVARSIVRRIMDFDVADAATYQHTPGTLWITSWEPVIGNSACGVYNGYIDPEFPSYLQSGAAPSQPTGPTEDPYDRSTVPSQKAGVCAVDSRT
jgi:hypothetical protein